MSTTVNPNQRVWRAGLFIVDLERVALAMVDSDGTLILYLVGSGDLVAAGSVVLSGPVRLPNVSHEDARSMIDAIEIYRSER